MEDLRELGIGDPAVVVTPPTLEINEEPSVMKEHLEWVTLELCFGVPLFHAEANRDVCDKVMFYILLLILSVICRLYHTTCLLRIILNF